MEKISTTATKIFCSRMREYTRQLLAVFSIFCIFTYTKYFQTALCLFLNPTQRCLGKAVTVKSLFSWWYLQNCFKILYIHHKWSRRISHYPHCREIWIRPSITQTRFRAKRPCSKKRRHLVGKIHFLI